MSSGKKLPSSDDDDDVDGGGGGGLLASPFLLLHSSLVVNGIIIKCRLNLAYAASKQTLQSLLGFDKRLPEKRTSLESS